MREKYKLSFTRKETGEVIEKEIDAYDLHKMCEMNWDYAEPGMLFSWIELKTGIYLVKIRIFLYAGTNPCA